MTSGGGWSRNRLHRTQVRGQVGVAQPGQERLHRVKAAVQREAEYATVAGHLAARDLVASMRLEPWIKDFRHTGMRSQESSDLEGAGVLLPDTQVKGLHAAQQQVRRHGFEAGAVDLAEMIDMVDQRLGSANNAAKRVSMAPEELGRAVHHQVGAQFQRTLVDRRSKRVVHDYHCADTMSRRSQPGNVDNLDGGIGGSLQVEELATAGNGCFDGLIPAAKFCRGVSRRTRR